MDSLLDVKQPTPVIIAKPNHYHCQVFERETLIGSCFIPIMHTTSGTRFFLEWRAWRIIEVMDGGEGFDKTIKCVPEFS